MSYALFDKSFNPDDDIDLSLFGHINSDAYLSGTYALEGNRFQRTIGYLNHYFERIAAEQVLPEAVLSLQKKINQLVEIEAEILRIRAMAPASALGATSINSELKKLSENIANNITTLEDGEYLSLPGGWLNLNSHGHAMVYQFKRTASGLEFYVHNAGDGIQYHERKSDTKRELYCPMQLYHIPEPIDNQQLALFLEELIKPELPNIRSGKETFFNAQRLYETVLPRIYFLNGVERRSALGMEKDTFTAGQLSGTCSQRALHQMLKENFQSLQEYQRFIYGYKCYALQQYMSVLTHRNKLNDDRVQKIIKNAINTLMRTINIPGLFTVDEVERERAELLKYREILRQAPIIAEESGEKLVIPSETKTTFLLTTVPRTLSPSTSIPVIPSVFDAADGIQEIVGGMALLSQMRAVIDACKTLEAIGKYTNIVEKLEHIFIKFPLEAANPYYSGITISNQDEFYRSIEQLQLLYFNACAKVSATTILPRMWVIGLTIVSVVNEVAYEVSNFKYRYKNTQDMLHRFLYGNFNNPYFANNDPSLDMQLQSIKELHRSRECLNWIALYSEIIDSEPCIKSHLTRIYHAPSESRLSSSIKIGQIEALYELITKFGIFEKNAFYRPLIEKIKTQQLIEQIHHKALSPFLSGSVEIDTMKISLTSDGDLRLDTTGYRTCAYATHNGKLSAYKYRLPDDSPYKHALMADYFHGRHGDGDNPYKTRDDNFTQLFPADISPGKSTDNIAAQPIDAGTLAARELFHLRRVPELQIQLTIDYFLKHLVKTKEVDCQIYIEANLFEPFLLLVEYDKNPDILNTLDAFIEAGLRYHNDEGFLSQASLFFIRLSFLVYGYINSLDRLKRFQARLTSLLEIEKQRDDTAIKHSIHYYQFLTAMTQLKGRHSGADNTDLLKLMLPSYFYMHASHNPHAPLDSADQFALACTKQHFEAFLMRANTTQIEALLGAILEQHHLGAETDEPPMREKELCYQIKMRQATGAFVYYKVDVRRGLIFNDKGMASVSVPLEIAKHPVMGFLHMRTLEPCFISQDGLVVEIGEPAELRFIRSAKEEPYRVQKKWMVNGEIQWYELHAHSTLQKSVFGVDSTVIQLPFPDIFQQRETQVWVHCGEIKHVIVTEQQHPMYYLTRGSYYESYSARQFNEDGTISGSLLCIGKTWLHEYFSQYEDPQFIIVTRQDSKHYEVTLARYGLTLQAYQDDGAAWVFRKKDKLSLIYMGEIGRSILGGAGLVFEDKNTHQRTCYVPLQRFVVENGPSAHSAFHNLQLDTHARIPVHMVEEAVPGSNKDKGLDRSLWEHRNNKPKLLPWQYTNSERFVHYSLDADGQPRAESAADALYLCYLYLGCQQPEEAWKVLEDCSRRLGGLKGSAEELERLHWILDALPFATEPEHEKAKMATPPYVACQLKALSLLTKVFTPGKEIELPLQAFDEKTPNGHYQNECSKKLHTFQKTLNTRLYQLYSRYQNMQRHLDVGFQLHDDERKSLLDYYHYHLPGDAPKALGALGYEWKVLELKTLKKEYDTLNAQRKYKGRLPEAYQMRLMEIQKQIQEEEAIYGHHTELALLPIDLSISKYVHHDLKKQCKDSVGARSWWKNIRIVPGYALESVMMQQLGVDVTEDRFLNYFPYYYQLAIDPSESANKKKLEYFCCQYLMMNHHVPLQEQETKIAYLCNILLRILKQQAAFVAELGNPPTVQCDAILDLAWNLPMPTLKIYQARNKVEEVIATKSSIWAALDAEELPQEAPMVAESCDLEAFSADAILQDCPLEENTRKQLKGLFKEYQKQAEIFHAPLEVFAPAPEMPIFDAERLVGKEQQNALSAMRNIADQILEKPDVCNALLKQATSKVACLQSTQDALAERLLNLANRGPLDPELNRRRILEIEGNVRAPLDIERLLALYFKADKAQYAVETGLSSDGIDALHTSLAHYVAYGVQQQALQRFCSKLAGLEGTRGEISSKQQIVHELLTKNLVSIEHEPAIALFQYYEHKLLRPRQKQAIERLLRSAGDGDASFGYHEAIEKIIMGGGKSKVILPLLAQNKATGTNLVVIEVPPALFETNCIDLSATSNRLFHQKAVPFQFNRDSDCSPESLKFLYDKLVDVMVKKDYLVTTGDAVQSLEMKYLEVLLQKPKEPENEALWIKQVEGLDKLIALFRTRADAIIDEVHQGLLLKKKLNYTLGEKRSFPRYLITECVELYRFFDKVPLDGVFAGKTLAHVLANNQWMTEPQQWDVVMASLAVALMEHPESPLRNFFSQMNPALAISELNDIHAYILGKQEKIPSAVLRCNNKMQSVFALYKEQISRFLPQNLKQNLNEHYGPSRLSTQDADHDGIAIPYSANNVPNERSRFANPLESINLSIQMLFLKGFTSSVLKNYLLTLQEQAREELKRDPSFGSMHNTPTVRGFQSICPDLILSELDLDDEDSFKAVFDALHRNKNLMCEVLKTQILPKITFESEILHSDAYNHVDIYRSCQGISGTPKEGMYHQRLSCDLKNALGSDGFILNVLEDKDTMVRAVDTSALKPCIEGLFAHRLASDVIRSIIDVSAAFKGVSNMEVAQALAKYVRKHPDIFSSPASLKYILFFNEHNVLCALDIQNKKNPPILIGSSDPEVIDAKLGGSPAERFSYYDQAHTIGVDLKQSSTAKGLVLVSHNTEIQSFLQGALRMRDIQEEQSIEMIVPQHLDGMTRKELMKRMIDNEAQQLKDDNLEVAEAKMTNLIRAKAMTRLVAIEQGDAIAKQRYAMVLKRFFVDIASSDFFEQYGDGVSLRKTKVLLEEHRDHLLMQWSNAVKELEGMITLREKKQLKNDLDSIIRDALPKCQESYLRSNKSQKMGIEVEVQKQVQVESQYIHQEGLQLSNPLLMPEEYRKGIFFFDRNLNAPIRHFMGDTLTTICQKTSSDAPDFGQNIYVSPNYYKTYKNQYTFFDAYLKPIHVLLFKKYPDGQIECGIVSQQDAADMMKSVAWPHGGGVWLSTTQHQVLKGYCSPDIRNNESYQDIIEKVRFFNGELSLMLEEDVAPQWLYKDNKSKLAFFEKYILPYRETPLSDFTKLHRSLSKKEVVFDFIAQNPSMDFQDYDWSTFGTEYSEEDQEEFEALAFAFHELNERWDNSDVHREYRPSRALSIQALGCFSEYVTDLMFLKKLMGFIDKAKYQDNEIDLDLASSWIERPIPGRKYKKQTLLSWVLQKAMYVKDNQKLLDFAQYLTEKNAHLDARDQEDHSILEQMLACDAPDTENIVIWLLQKGIQGMSYLKAYAHNEQFLMALMTHYQRDRQKLLEIFSFSSPELIEKFIKKFPKMIPKRISLENNYGLLLTIVSHKNLCDLMMHSASEDVQQTLNALLEDKRQLADGWMNALDTYQKNRQVEYKWKDYIASKDKNERMDFMEQLKELIEVYKTSNKYEGIISFIDKGLHQFPGLHLKPLLNSIKVQVLEFEHPTSKETSFEPLALPDNIPNKKYVESIKLLDKKISEMYAYGEKTNHSDIKNLATELKKDLRHFIQEQASCVPKLKAYKAFKEKFIARLHSKDDKMETYDKHEWKKRIANILMILLIIPSIISKIKTGRKSLFFKTEKLKYIEEINDATEKTGPMLDDDTSNLGPGNNDYV